VKQPRYIIRLGENLPQNDDTLVERTLFYVPDQASFVFTQSLRGNKGSDASNIYDEEINDDVLLKSTNNH
jgi:H/ACA ribonucleoprotein complex non-core subunit NAF1